MPGYYGIEDVYLSLPAILGESGVEKILKLNLDEKETAALQHSAQVMHGVIEQLDIQPL